MTRLQYIKKKLKAKIHEVKNFLFFTLKVLYVALIFSLVI